MVNLLGEDDVELDNEVAFGTVGFGLQRCGCVSNDITSQSAGHALAFDTKLGLRRDNIGRCHEHLPIIKCVHSDWLHLQCLYERQSVRVDQVISVPH